MMNQKLQIKHLQLSLEPEDQQLAMMIDGIFHNDFAVFVVKTVRGDEYLELRELAATLESFVAGYIQNDSEILDRLGDRDIVWDIYLVFLVEGQIPVELRVALENDRFYCKKIILPYQRDQGIEEQLQQMIMYKQFADLSLRESEYLGKGEFLSRLMQDVEDERLRNFMQKHDLLTLESKQLLAKFKKFFKLSVGDENV